MPMGLKMCFEKRRVIGFPGEVQAVYISCVWDICLLSDAELFSSGGMFPQMGGVRGVDSKLDQTSNVVAVEKIIKIFGSMALFEQAHIENLKKFNQIVHLEIL